MACSLFFYNINPVPKSRVKRGTVFFLKKIEKEIRIEKVVA